MIKKVLAHRGQKSKKQKEKAQTNREVNENNDTRFKNETIEADNASEIRPPPFRDKGFQNDASPRSEEVSSLSFPKDRSATTEANECARRSLKRDMSYTANRDSGISLFSNISATSSISETTELSATNISATNISETNHVSATSNISTANILSATNNTSATSKISTANILSATNNTSATSKISTANILSTTNNASATSNISTANIISVTSNTLSDETCLQSDLHTKYDGCPKHPKHNQFIPVVELSLRHMPENFQDPIWVDLIKLKATGVVRLTVAQTSDTRPDELGFRGSTAVRFGSGTAFVHNMDKTELCDCGAGETRHRCSGPFLVMTASHVVYDDYEAKATSVDFFYDSTDVSTIVRGWGVRVVSVDVERNRSIVECRTHDLNLYNTLKKAQQERNEIIEKELEPEVGSSQMTVLISHPHGLCKQVSFGNLKKKSLVGVVKTSKDGIQVADCLLTYDTPTCPGSGGGPVNVMGGGAVSYAFAPHCSSKGTDESLSGLGWARVL